MAILLGDAVETSVVDTEAEGSIRLFYKEYRGAVRGCAGFDKFFREKVIKLFFKFVEFGDGEADDGFERWVGSGVGFDTHRVTTVGWEARGEG